MTTGMKLLLLSLCVCLTYSQQVLDLTSRLSRHEVANNVDIINKRIKSNKVDMPRVGLRFKNDDSDMFIEKMTKFAVGTIDIKMIELPTEFHKIEPILRGVKAAGLKREDVFLSFKQDTGMFGIDDTKEEIENLWKISGLDYIDLYMIHYLDTKGFYLETWKVMIDAMHQGNIKAIGLCNVNIGHLNYIYLHTGVLPAVVELEIHPFFQQSKMAKQLQQLGIVLQAFAPLAAAKKMYEPRLLRIAKRYEKTVAQTMIRWCLQKGYSCISSSRKINRIAENVDVFDFELSQDDMMLIDALDDNFVTSFDPSNMHHLTQVDTTIGDKLKERLAELDDSTKPSSQNYNIWFEAKEPALDVNEELRNDTTFEEEPIEETLEPMYFSTDININVTPESEKKRKEVDEAFGEEIGKCAEPSTSKVTESDVFHVPLSEISQTCNRLTKERYEQAMREAEEMQKNNNKSGNIASNDEG